MVFLLKASRVVEARYGQHQIGDLYIFLDFFVKEREDVAFFVFSFIFCMRVWRLIVYLGFILEDVESSWDCIVKAYKFIHLCFLSFVHICIDFCTYLYLFLYICVYVWLFYSLFCRYIIVMNIPPLFCYNFCLLFVYFIIKEICV